VAERFLLNYSEKLWGTPASTISHQITGQRLKTLTLRTILMEALGAPSPRPRHYEGAFYYPRSGFGAITDALAESCGYDHIRLNARITRLRHDGSRVQAIELNGNELVPADEVVSTLPLNRLVRAMDPPLDPEILGLAESLRFRSLILVALFANKESITPNATVYFPESRFPFSRVTEPRNRSRPMSPPHATSLVAEVACWEGDEMWRASDSALAGMVARNLIEIGWIQERDVVDSAVVRMHHAYPVLELGLQEKVEKIQDCLKCFENLTVLGRSGLFQYTSLHHMMRFGKDTVERYVGGQ
jgi:protoporphyrinogen oxidase